MTFDACLCEQCCAVRLSEQCCAVRLSEQCCAVRLSERLLLQTAGDRLLQDHVRSAGRADAGPVIYHQQPHIPH